MLSPDLTLSLVALVQADLSRDELVMHYQRTLRREPTSEEFALVGK